MGEHVCSLCTGLWQVQAWTSLCTSRLRQTVPWPSFDWSLTQSPEGTIFSVDHRVGASKFYTWVTFSYFNFEKHCIHLFHELRPIKGGQTSATVHSIPASKVAQLLQNRIATPQRCTNVPRYCSVHSHHVPSATACTQGSKTNFRPHLKQIITCWDKGCWWALSHLFIDINGFLVLLQLCCVSCYFHKALVCWTEKENQNLLKSTHIYKNQGSKTTK